jgi:hypothetical protein
LGTEEVLIAPVRPSWKERYPLVPIEGYAGLARWLPLRPVDARPRAPWRKGAQAKPQSLRITGSVPEWHTGAYWEQNVRMEHTI